MAQPQLPTLTEIEAAIWQQLARAPRDKHHEWRTPVLATAGAGGADARTVVLREVHVAIQQLVIYTDTRAAKVAQLRLQPHGTLVLWSARLGWQLRCSLHCAVHDEGLKVSSRWERLKLTRAAQDYLSPAAPGSALDGAAGPSPQPVSHRACFAVIEAQVLAIDWLELHPQGHRRAVFKAGQAALWVTP